MTITPWEFFGVLQGKRKRNTGSVQRRRGLGTSPEVGGAEEGVVVGGVDEVVDSMTGNVDRNFARGMDLLLSNPNRTLGRQGRKRPN